MTREAFKTDRPDAEAFTLSGALLNQIGRALNAGSGGVRATGMNVRRGATDGSSPDLPPRQTDLIQIKNTTGTDLRRYEIVALGEIVDQWEGIDELPLDEEPVVNGEKPSGGYCKIAVLLREAKSSLAEVVDAQVSGVCPALIDIKNEMHRRAHPVKNSFVLESDFCGPAEILWKPAEVTGEQLCLIRLGAGQSVHVLVKVDSDGIDAATYNQASIDPGEAEVDVYHWDTDLSMYVPLRDSSDVVVTLTAKNLAAEAIDGGDYGKLLWVASDDDWMWPVVVEYCVAGFPEEEESTASSQSASSQSASTESSQSASTESSQSESSPSVSSQSESTPSASSQSLTTASSQSASTASTASTQSASTASTLSSPSETTQSTLSSTSPKSESSLSLTSITSEYSASTASTASTQSASTESTLSSQSETTQSTLSSTSPTTASSQSLSSQTESSQSESSASSGAATTGSSQSSLSLLTTQTSGPGSVLSESSLSCGTGSGGGCMLTSAALHARGLGNNCTELKKFRELRDEYLAKTPKGRALIDEYYRMAPGMVRTINAMADGKSVYDRIFEDIVIPCVALITKKRYAEATAYYLRKVNELQASLSVSMPSSEG